MIKADLGISPDDRKKYPHHTDGSIMGIKLVKAQPSAYLMVALTEGGENFDALLKEVGKDTNPNWLTARIADELYDRDELSQVEYAYHTR